MLTIALGVMLGILLVPVAFFLLRVIGAGMAWLVFGPPA